MNVMPDGTGWLLPPRCAARYTMGVMWRYGVQSLTYHDIIPEIEVSQIIMNIRNPFSRIRSWLRLWNTTLPEPLSAKTYIENLHTGSRGVQWVNVIENPNSVDLPWKYLFPLHFYTDQLAMVGKEVNHFIRQEHLEEDMEAAGYPTHGYQYDQNYDSANDGDFSEDSLRKAIRIGFGVKDTKTKWEPGDGQADIDFYSENPLCADIVATYYRKDFEIFGYSMNIGDIND